jgi:hypothetical protein
MGIDGHRRALDALIKLQSVAHLDGQIQLGPFKDNAFQVIDIATLLNDPASLFNWLRKLRVTAVMTPFGEGLCGVPKDIGGFFGLE